MRLDSSGRLGLGTSTFIGTELLNVAGTSLSRAQTLAPNNSGTTAGTSNVEFEPVYLGASGSTATARICFVRPSTSDGNYSSYISFFTRLNGQAIGERVRITEAGNVGIGTASPAFAASYTGLHLDGGANGPVVRLTNSTTGSTATDGFDIILQQAGSEAYIWQRESAPIILGTAATERARIDSSGRVGIGTTSPGCALDVVSQTVPQFRVRYTSGGNYVSLLHNDSDGYLDTTAGGLVFRTNTSTERARITSDGKLLVGTSSSASAGLIETVGNTFATSAVVARSTANDAIPTGFVGARIRGSSIVQSGDRLSVFVGRGYDGSAYLDAGFIEVAVDGTPGANDMPGRLVFSTTIDGQSSPTERTRITQDGRLVHGGSNNAFYLGTVSTSTADFLIIGRNAITLGNVVGTGSDRFLVRSDGNVTNTNNSYGQISDAKLKENISLANTQWQDIKNIEVVNFNFIGDEHRQIGVVAQQIEQVSPGLVDETPDRDEEGNKLETVTKSVKYSVLYMKAVKALQEAMERIEQLETEMAEVKAQLQAS